MNTPQKIHEKKKPAIHKIRDQSYWNLMRLVVICTTICAVLGLFLAFNYNRFDARDWQTIIGTIAAAAGSLIGFDKLKSKITGTIDHENGNSTEEKPKEN